MIPTARLYHSNVGSGLAGFSSIETTLRIRMGPPSRTPGTEAMRSRSRVSTEMEAHTTHGERIAPVVDRDDGDADAALHRVGPRGEFLVELREVEDEVETRPGPVE